MGETRASVEGGVAQSGERLLCKQEVIGSIPFTSTSPRPRGRHLGQRITETGRSPGASRRRPDGDPIAVMLFVIVNGKCDAAVAVRRERGLRSGRARRWRHRCGTSCVGFIPAHDGFAIKR